MVAKSLHQVAQAPDASTVVSAGPHEASASHTSQSKITDEKRSAIYTGLSGANASAAPILDFTTLSPSIQSALNELIEARAAELLASKHAGSQGKQPTSPADGEPPAKDKNTHSAKAGLLSPSATQASLADSASATSNYSQQNTSPSGSNSFSAPITIPANPDKNMVININIHNANKSGGSGLGLSRYTLPFYLIAGGVLAYYGAPYAVSAYNGLSNVYSWASMPFNMASSASDWASSAAEAASTAASSVGEAAASAASSVGEVATAAATAVPVPAPVSASTAPTAVPAAAAVFASAAAARNGFFKKASAGAPTPVGKSSAIFKTVSVSANSANPLFHVPDENNSSAKPSSSDSSSTLDLASAVVDKTNSTRTYWTEPTSLPRGLLRQ